MLPLFPISAIEQDRHWSIIAEGNLHVGTEDATMHGYCSDIRELRAELFVKRFGFLGVGGAQERRAIAFLCRGMEGELTYY